MRIILGNSGKYTVVDKIDYASLNKYKWHLNSNGYAYRNFCKQYQVKKVYLHRLILDFPQDGEIDHINRNKLDNRRINLRVVGRSENSFNKGLQRNNTSGHRGVSWCRANNAWKSYITKNSQRKTLGYFKERNRAIEVRKEAELLWH